MPYSLVPSRHRCAHERVQSDELCAECGFASHLAGTRTGASASNLPVRLRPPPGRLQTCHCVTAHSSSVSRLWMRFPHP